MSERFKYYFPSQIIKDKQSGERYYGNKPLAELLNELHEENKEFKALLDKMSDCNNEIWLDDGRIYRLRKAFKGEWVK